MTPHQTRQVYRGRVVSLDIDTVRFPNGITGELEMVRHPGAAAVVPLLDAPDSRDPRLVLIRQYRHAAAGFLYEVPAGRMDFGESPENCALRELREETGYSAGSLAALTTFYTTPGFTDERIHLFIAWDLVPGASSLETDEVLDLHEVPLSRAVEMVGSGEIVDGKSMLGILLSGRRLKLE